MVAVRRMVSVGWNFSQIGYFLGKSNDCLFICLSKEQELSNFLLFLNLFALQNIDRFPKSVIFLLIDVKMVDLYLQSSDLFFIFFVSSLKVLILFLQICKKLFEISIFRLQFFLTSSFFVYKLLDYFHFFSLGIKFIVVIARPGQAWGVII